MDEGLPHEGFRLIPLPGLFAVEGEQPAHLNHSSQSKSPPYVINVNRIVITTAAALLMLIAVPIDSASAQTFGAATGQEAQGVSYHRFARPGEATVRVWVVSDQRSGLYEVGESVSLGELLVLSGTGPGLITVRERRNTTVRVFRGDRSTRGMIYEASFEEMLQNPGAYPSLRTEDAVVVETRVSQRFNWRDAVSVISAASSTILLIERFRRL